LLKKAYLAITFLSFYFHLKAVAASGDLGAIQELNRRIAKIG
jgi:hypothetical protein